MPEKTRVCIDGRLSAAAETGVASYGHAVRAALDAVGWQAEMLMDAAGGRFGMASGRLSAATRAVRATLRLPVRVRTRGAACELFAHDIYRLAQVRFRQTGELLPLHVSGPPGVMHWTYPIPARIRGWANIYTVHDVIPLTAAHLSPMEPHGLRKRLERIAESASRIVAVSAWARRSIIDELKLAPGLVTNCGSGLTGLTPGDGTLPAGLIHGGYFLYCGLFEARKNLDRLAAGWHASGRSLPLVITGPEHKEDRAIRASLVERGVTLLPYQPRPALVDLMQGARALLFPTLEEGFGLPVVEAMALGVPVMTADRGAVAETAGGAAYLVDANDVTAITRGICRLQDDDALHAALAGRGTLRAEAFSPIAFGRRLTALYTDLAPS